MTKAWRCQIGWHAYVIRRNPESGATAMIYRECRRCAKQKDVTHVLGGLGAA